MRIFLVAPLTSFVWKYITNSDKTGGKCSICHKFVKSSSNTSNYQKHLEQHGIFGRKKEKSTMPKQLPTSSDIRSPARKRQRVSDEHESMSITETPKSLGQPRLADAIKKQLSFKSKYCIFNFFFRTFCLKKYFFI